MTSNQTIYEKINLFLSSAPVNKLVIVSDRNMLTDLQVFDVGHDLALFLKDKKEIRREDFEFIIQEELSRLFNQNIQEHQELGKYICICNIGILFEKELNVNILQTLKRISRNNLVILLWEGEIKLSTLFFLSKNSKHKIDLRETNHIILS